MDREKSKKAAEAVRRVLKCEAEEIMGISGKIEEEDISKMLEILKSCRGKVITAGCGTSGVAARKAAHTFSCIEMPAFFLSPSTALHGGMGAVQRGDVVIFFSKGGCTGELVPMIRACREKGAAIVTVTEAKECLLAKNSDLVLEVKIEKEPDTFNMLATASTLAVIAVFDAIAIALAEEKGYTKEEFFLIHPGGEVGERLARQTGKENQ